MNVIFLFACAIALLASVYLTVARCYNTGFLGATGLSFVAVVSVYFLAQWFVGIEESPPSLQTEALMFGISLFMTQHCFRVIIRMKFDRRKYFPWGNTRLNGLRRGDLQVEDKAT